MILAKDGLSFIAELPARKRVIEISDENARRTSRREEKKYVNGPVERLCEALHPWEIHKTRELSSQAWDIIRKEKLLGMIIPKEYGGLGFSALAHSEVIMKLSSRSIPAAISVS